MWWLFLVYAVLLVVVVFLSNKVAKYTDYIEGHTKLTGALLGGIVLAGITSLPELVTSITSSLLGEPGLVQGDIFGSNIFDVCIIGVIMLVFVRTVLKSNVAKDNAKFVLYTGLICSIIIIATILEVFTPITFVIPGINVNALTIVCLVLYFVAIFTTQKTNEEDGKIEQSTDTTSSGQIQKQESTITLKQVVVRFVICAVFLIGVSVAITFLSNIISNEYGLGKGLAGALFLGVATSLPEIISSFTLVKMGNYNAAYGNIIGSCLFNFMVLGIADIFYFGGSVFIANVQSILVGVCLLVALFAMYLSYILKVRTKKGFNKVTVSMCGVLMLASYVAFLVLLA